jgi:hypothetical protein
MPVPNHNKEITDCLINPESSAAERINADRKMLSGFFKVFEKFFFFYSCIVA